MAEEKTEQTTQKSDKKDDMFKNAPSTLNTTDPQDHMEGPLSSVLQSIGLKAKDNDHNDKADTDEGKGKSNTG